MTGRRSWTLVLVVAVTAIGAACPSPYRERPPQTETRAPDIERQTETAIPDTTESVSVRDAEPDYDPPRVEDLDPSAPAPARNTESITVVGTIGRDGTYRADTLAGVQPDTSRVQRETVVTGALRARQDLPVTGYRVQIFATEDQDIATRIVDDLRDQGVEDPVYVERDALWFKVRVGDFADRAAADRARSRLVALGFSGAWIVHTTIRTFR